MNSNLKRVLALTAGLMTLGAAAIYGETRAEVDVTFPFSTVAGILPAGTYTVQRVSDGGIAVLMLRNKQTHQPTLLVGNRLAWEESRPKLVFRCIDGRCSLAKLWLGSGSWEFMQPRLDSAQKSHLATVDMRP